MDYPNTGALWRTKEKKNPKAPDMYGDVKVDKYYLKDLIENADEDVVMLKLSGWTRETKDGRKFLSITVDTYKPKESTNGNTNTQTEDDDIPF